MDRSIYLTGLLLAAACSPAAEGPDKDASGGRIVFAAMETRAVSESTVSSVKAGGFEVAGVTQGVTYFVDKAEWSEQDGWFSTEKAYYYPPGAVSFYAAHPAGDRIRIENGQARLDYESDYQTDLVAALRENVTASSEEVGLNFSHILSQVKVRWNGMDELAEYEVMELELSAAASGSWDFSSRRWSGLKAGKVTLDVGDPVTVIPSEMILRMRWSCLQDGRITASYDKSVTFAPAAGKVCTVNCSLPNSDSQKIGLSVEVSDWGTDDSSVSLSSAVRPERVPVQFSAPQNTGLDLFAFRKDGTLDVHARQTGDILTARLTKGESLCYWLIANLPDGSMDSVTDRDGLLGSKLFLADNSAGSPLMVGKGERTFIGNDNETVHVDRAVCKVFLGILRPSFLSTGLLAGTGVSLDRVFLMNAPSSIPVSLEPSAADLCNVGRPDETLPPALSAQLTRTPCIPLSDASAKNLGMAFYCCPDPSGNTRLVLEMTVCGIKNYYPVPLPAMQSNREYRIAELELLGWGSASPEVPVNRGRLSWDLTVMPWGTEEKNFVMN